jgi:hypothetical protein
MGRIADLGAQRPCSGVGPIHLRGCQTLGDTERRPEGQLQIELLSRPRGGVGERGEQRQAFREATHRFHVGRALDSALPRPLPVRDGLRHQACLGVVMRQQLWLGLDGLREP